jgi:hypothetical protein
MCLNMIDPATRRFKRIKLPNVTKSTVSKTQAMVKRQYTYSEEEQY